MSDVALHALDRHTLEWMGVHGPALFGRPHMPSPPHTLVTHSPLPAQDAPLSTAHVLLTGLQVPLEHTAALAMLQRPSWRPSFGIGVPEPRLVTHKNVLPSQYSPELHSESCAQPPLGMQVEVPVEHTPD